MGERIQQPYLYHLIEFGRTHSPFNMTVRERDGKWTATLCYGQKEGVGYYENIFTEGGATMDDAIAKIAFRCGFEV